MLAIILFIIMLYNALYCFFAKEKQSARGIWPTVFLCLSCAAMLGFTLLLYARELSVY